MFISQKNKKNYNSTSSQNRDGTFMCDKTLFSGLKDFVQ